MHTSCPQDMLLSWTCRNVFDPKPCLFFPTILVSLIKETTSVHKFCFSGSFHYNICCHKPLGIHRSLSLCLSLSQTQMKSYPTIRLSLCAKERCGSVKGCHQMSWQAGATQCSAGRRCGLASQSHADSRAQHCTGASPGEISPSAPYCSISSHRHASNHLWDFSSLGAWWLWKNIISIHEQEKITKWFVTNYSPCSKNNQLISFKRGQRGSLQAREHFSPRKIS